MSAPLMKVLFCVGLLTVLPAGSLPWVVVTRSTTAANRKCSEREEGVDMHGFGRGFNDGVRVRGRRDTEKRPKAELKSHK